MKQLFVLALSLMSVASFAFNTHDIEVCNDSSWDAQVAITYYQQGQWWTESAWYAPRQTCSVVKRQVAGPVYGYAWANGVGAWPSANFSSWFCVSKYGPSLNTQAPCNQGTPGFEMVGFRAFNFTAPYGTHTWRLENR